MSTVSLRAGSIEASASGMTVLRPVWSTNAWYASVVTTIPGGTGSPCRTTSPSLLAFPPTSGRSESETSERFTTSGIELLRTGQSVGDQVLGRGVGVDDVPLRDRPGVVRAIPDHGDKLLRSAVRPRAFGHFVVVERTPGRHRRCDRRCVLNPSVGKVQ